MGKRYEADLSQLTATYEWAVKAPVDPLLRFVDAALTRPLLAVGSGGSFTAAEMARLLHQQIGRIATSATPLHLIWSPHGVRESAVLLLTAGGRNPDIISAFRAAVTAEPRQLLAVCTATKTPLARLARQYADDTHVLEAGVPSGKDGFLATNSLLATLVFLIRAYARWAEGWDQLPARLPGGDGTGAGLDAVLARDTWIVLYGGWGGPAAVDLESKCSEVALANIRPADYRNFAHGRHYWLAAREASTGVLALVGPDDEDLAERTLRLVPETVPVFRLTTEVHGPVGGLDLFVRALHLVARLGRSREVDPGHPSVPTFGRRLYHLGLPRTLTIPLLDIAVAVQRKQAAAGGSKGRVAQEAWLRAYRDFRRRLERARFGAIVFDYDGTLCGPQEQYTGPGAAVERELTRLLRSGTVVGIATGRGKSVRTDIERLMGVEADTSRILVGYYNGSDIAPLADATRPHKFDPLHPSLAPVVAALEAHPGFGHVASFEQSGPRQLSVTPRRLPAWPEARAILLDIVAKLTATTDRGPDGNAPTDGVRVVESGHSLDVLAPGVSKLHLVEACKRLASQLGLPPVALCIGDRGEWPGNDAALLSTPYSLSADTVSPDPLTCWNLAPAGIRGVQATLSYLAALEVHEHGARLVLGTPGRATRPGALLTEEASR